MKKAKVLSHEGTNGRDLAGEVQRRVRVICGDLTQQKLGMTHANWDQLTSTVGTVYHCGAEVDYVKTYRALRGANVAGTQEVGAIKQSLFLETDFCGIIPI